MPIDPENPAARLRSAPPDDWAVAAAELPLAFAQVREDPRLDVTLAARLAPGATVVMIASGGETAVELGRLPLGALHLVDMNPAQLDLTRLKWRLAAERDIEFTCRLLGHLPLPADQRIRDLREILDTLNIDLAAFGPEDVIGVLGPDHAGRYERTFAQLRVELEPVRADLHRVLETHDCESAAKRVAPATPLGKALDAAFDRVLSLPNLVRLFGTEATRNPRQSFSRHFAERTRVAIRRTRPATNPFLWQMLAGCFPAADRYDWFHPRRDSSPVPRTTPVYHQGRMRDVLEDMRPDEADLVHLSNICDWLEPAAAQATLHSAGRVLKRGGRVILRQLNSTIAIRKLEAGIEWDHALGERMEQVDRSFFYPVIHVGSKR